MWKKNLPAIDRENFRCVYERALGECASVAIAGGVGIGIETAWKKKGKMSLVRIAVDRMRMITIEHSPYSVHHVGVWLFDLRCESFLAKYLCVDNVEWCEYNMQTMAQIRDRIMAKNPIIYPYAYAKLFLRMSWNYFRNTSAGPIFSRQTPRMECTKCLILKQSVTVLARQWARQKSHSEPNSTRLEDGSKAQYSLDTE